jgi:tRNA 2-selenouridine synthase
MDPHLPLESLESLPGLSWVDVRTVEEFRNGHIPGAASLPVLDFAERARVSEVYYAAGNRAAQLAAIDVIGPRLGAMVRAIADLCARGPVALYCWRGGMRSGILGRFVCGLGLPVHVLAGGYKAHRRAVCEALRTGLPPLVVLHGYTGSGKTRLLRSLSDRFRVVDIEAIGNHRGSTFGAVGLPPQPTQRQFESELVAAFRRCRPGPVLVEAESPSLGALTLPASLCQAMRSGQRIFLNVPRAARARLLLNEYGPLIAADPGSLEPCFRYLTGRLPRPEVEALRALVAGGDLLAFSERLLARHYDRLYERWRARAAGTFWREIAAGDLASAETQLAVALGESCSLAAGESPRCAPGPSGPPDLAHRS